MLSLLTLGGEGDVPAPVMLAMLRLQSMRPLSVGAGVGEDPHARVSGGWRELRAAHPGHAVCAGPAQRRVDLAVLCTVRQHGRQHRRCRHRVDHESQ